MVMKMENLKLKIELRKMFRIYSRNCTVFLVNQIETAVFYLSWMMRTSNHRISDVFVCDSNAFFFFSNDSSFKLSATVFVIQHTRHDVANGLKKESLM